MITSIMLFVCLCSFEYLEKTRRYIDVWPLCVWQNETFDTTFLLLLQLACVLHMKQGKSKAELRIFIVVESKWYLHYTYFVELVFIRVHNHSAIHFQSLQTHKIRRSSKPFYVAGYTTGPALL